MSELLPSPTWLSSLRSDGQILFRVGRRGDARVAEWPGLARLECSSSGDDARFIVEPGADAILAAKVEGGVARALVRHLKGQWSLHGACIARDGVAVVLLGASGAGKSTAAALLAARPGAALLADDITFIEERDGETWILPSEERVWLLEASAKLLHPHADEGPFLAGEKRPYAARAALGPARLVGVVALAFAGEAPALREAKGAEVFSWLVPSVVRFAVDDRSLCASELAFLAALVRAVPTCVFERPQSLEADMVEAGLACLEAVWPAR